MQWAVLPRYEYAQGRSFLHVLFRGTEVCVPLSLPWFDFGLPSDHMGVFLFSIFVVFFKRFQTRASKKCSG